MDACPPAALPCRAALRSPIWLVRILLVVAAIDEGQQREVGACLERGRMPAGRGTAHGWQQAGAALGASIAGAGGSWFSHHTSQESPHNFQEGPQHPPEPKQRDSTCPSAQRTSPAVTPPSRSP